MELFSFLAYYMVVFSWVLFIMYRALFGDSFNLYMALFWSSFHDIKGSLRVYFPYHMRAFFGAPLYDTEAFSVFFSTRCRVVFGGSFYNI